MCVGSVGIEDRQGAGNAARHKFTHILIIISNFTCRKSCPKTVFWPSGSTGTSLPAAKVDISSLKIQQTQRIVVTFFGFGGLQTVDTNTGKKKY